jgi:hypothetical protein
MNKDIEHLNLLAIFHYISAGLLLLFSLFPLIYVAFGVMFLAMSAQTVPAPPGQPGPPPGPPPAIGWIFIIGGTLASLLLVATAIVTAIAGRCLQRHTNRVFCFIVAGLLCLGGIPIIILGIFTIIVLCRPSVQDLFAGKYRFHDPEDEDGYRDRDHFKKPGEVVREPDGEPDDRPRGRPDDRGIYSPRRDDY